MCRYAVGNIFFFPLFFYVIVHILIAKMAKVQGIVEQVGHFVATSVKQLVVCVTKDDKFKFLSKS